MAECNTNNQSCDAPKASEGGCTLAEDLLCLAKCAKHELIKDKMKAHLEAKMGKTLDKLALAAVEAMLACLDNKMSGKQACDKYQAAIQAAFKG